MLNEENELPTKARSGTVKRSGPTPRPTIGGRSRRGRRATKMAFAAKATSAPGGVIPGVTHKPEIKGSFSPRVVDTDPNDLGVDV